MKALRITSYVVMAIGVLLYATGILFKIQHWPDLFKGIISGPLFLIIGVLLFFISLVAIRKSKK